MNSVVCVLIIYILYLWNVPFLFLCNSPHWARASSFSRCPDHKQRRTTVGRILWTSDQLVAKTYTWQNTTFKTDIHPRWSKEDWSDNITNELRVLKLFMETDLRNICTLYENFFPWNVQLQDGGRTDIFFTCFYKCGTKYV